MPGTRASEVPLQIARGLDDPGRPVWITRSKTDHARRRLHAPDVLRPLLPRLADGKAPG